MSLLFLALAASAPTGDTPPEPTTIAIGADRSERMTVPVRIADLEGIPFVVDTGAERTVVSRQLADRLGLPNGPVRRLVTVTGTGDVQTVIVPRIEVSGGAAIKDVEAPALDALHLGASGLLGLDSLQQRRILLDFKNNRMTVASARRIEERWDDDTIVVRGKSRYGQLILVDSSIDGRRIQVIIDTGAQTSIGNLALLKKLTGKRRSAVTAPVTLTSVTGQSITAQFTQVHQIRLGGMTLNHLPVAFTDAEPFRRFGLANRPALLLGMDALRLFERVSVDFANKQVKFLPPDTSALDRRTVLAAR